MFAKYSEDFQFFPTQLRGGKKKENMILSLQGPFATCWQEKWSKIHGLIVLLINWWIGCWEPELPKVVKVNHLAAYPSFRLRQASLAVSKAKANTCRSPGRLFFRGHLHSSRLTVPTTVEGDRSWCQPLSSGNRNHREEGRRCYRSGRRHHRDARGCAWEGPAVAPGGVFLPSIADLDLKTIKLRHRPRVGVGGGGGCARKALCWEPTVTKEYWCLPSLKTLDPPRVSLKVPLSVTSQRGPVLVRRNLQVRPWVLIGTQAGNHIGNLWYNLPGNWTKEATSLYH